MPISQILADQLKRLGVSLPEDASSVNVIDYLSSEAEYADAELYGNVGRYRQLLKQEKVTKFDDFSDEQLNDEMPLISTFKLCHGQEIWDDWEEEFDGVKPGMQMFASDDYHYFFLAENPDDAGDPLVLDVDHEDISEEPERFDFYVTMTAGKLLSFLAER